jgi:hypothetical protein
MVDKGQSYRDTESVSMEKDDLGRYVIELNESAAITVEQIEDKITVIIASVVGVNFQLSAAQALELSRALAAAAANAMAESDVAATAADQ